MIIAITGHRPDKLGNEYDLIGPYSENIRLNLQRIIDTLKPDKIISGMALGVDTIWALLGIKNNLQVIAAIPCANHSAMWPVSSKMRYEEILANPLVTIQQISDEPYTHACMQKRNEWMVDNCDLLISVWDKSKGGTANCVKYADDVVKRKRINIDPSKFGSIV